MVNVVDLVMGLTGKLITSLLSWPFLLFVLIIWLANRYRDHIGSILDRRGAIKRADFSSAIRNELESVNKEIGDLKLLASELKSQVGKIGAAPVGDAIGSVLEPIDGRIKTLETGIETVRSDMQHLLVTRLSEELHLGIMPLNEEMGRLGEEVGRLRSKLAELESGSLWNSAAETIERLSSDVEELKTEVNSFAVRGEEWAPRALSEELAGSLERMDGDLRGFNAVLQALQADQRVSNLQVRLDGLDGRLAETDAQGSTDVLNSATDRFHEEIEAVRGDVARLSAQVDGIASHTHANALNARIEETRKDLADLRETVGRLRVPLEKLSSQVVDIMSDGEGLTLASKSNPALPLEIMKQEMRTSRWEWRRVRRLAKSVGMTEEAAEAILENDPEVTLSKDDWGRKIAKLSIR